ncbi:phosphatase PAP2 family protein [Ureibacillus xyleni]|uniref:phosphatase PAP2 family protein n=1 Tax=Ureibacillus xyleni TaxID=614648 RepID=UPI001F3FB9A3|nr:phosphatase PAP2 family protein [Ureibacillus xyleni]
MWLSYDTSFIEAFDQNVSNLLYGLDFITLFHYLGETKVIFCISFILLIFIWIRVGDLQLTLFVLLTVGFGYGLYQFLKHLIERPRPEIADQLSTYSFPSGHAVHGMLYLLTIAYVLSKVVASKKASRIVWSICIILFILIGTSRITEGRHYASDVLAGWMLGYSWFMICVWWYEHGHRKKIKNKTH